MPLARVIDDTTAWVGTFDYAGTFKLGEMKLSELRAAIKRESGGPVRVGSKGLIFKAHIGT